jgi:hypothetical protein
MQTTTTTTTTATKNTMKNLLHNIAGILFVEAIIAGIFFAIFWN